MASRGGATTITSIDDLISRELDTVKEIRNTREKVEGTSQALDGVFMQLATAESVLAQVRDDHGLQTAAVGEQIKAVLDIIQDLKTVVRKLKPPKSPFRKLSRHKLNDDDPYNEQLNNIHNRFDKALHQVSLQISEVTVNLEETLEGRGVALNIRTHTNTELNEMFGTNPAPMNFPQEQQMVQRKVVSAETMALEPVDSEGFKQDAPQTSDDDKAPETSNDRKASTDFDRVLIYENDVTGKMQIISGNVGVGSGYKPAFNGRSTVHNNKVGADARIITGDVGGQAAVELLKGFWD
ncbi:hypothetical protein PT974_07401 [Cladobotryum mycophilum]|uniref:Uncharacterized protein n=1 Tax=Cladobotryum mycophilum TaxID=491253 RepID=A0ABR0SPE6_9HYPO